jgi:hypothetical protein
MSGIEYFCSLIRICKKLKIEIYMKIKVKIALLIMGLLGFTMACNNKSTADQHLAPNVHKVEVEEVIQTNNYTYLRVSEDGTENWLAITRREVKEGGEYYYEPGMEMSNFVSKELKRTFPSIWFVDNFSDQPILKKINVADSMGGKREAIRNESIKIEKVSGSYSIAELYSQRESLAGKTVKIKAQVVKFSPDIMKTNWVHIQDGTGSDGAFDLAVTTDETVNPGDVAIFEGTLSVKKDFGAGYFYEVIIEKAKVLKEM